MSNSWLITGDWQADSRNLGLIQQAAARERQVMLEYGCTNWIDMGDLKNPYNPFDARIAIAMQDRVRDKDGYAIMGNHDRLSQNDNELTWFDLLDTGTNASSKYITKPCVLPREGVTFYVLPYNGEVDVLRKNAAWLAEQAHTAGYSSASNNERVLLFHCDLREADYGHGRLSLDSLTVADLQLSNYEYAFGGHVHKPQEIIPGTAMYVGSPFCMDWGEANQQKRFIVYTPGEGFKSVPVGLPAFYDWDAAKNMTPEELKGCTVRFKIKVKDGVQFRALSRKRQEQFAAKYPETMLHLLPVYDNIEVADYTFTQGNDEDKVRGFVKEFKSDDKELADYVVKTLEKATSVRSINTEGMRLLSATGKNYTSFDKVKFDYRNRGVVLVKGQNRDWPGRSNGSGKTNFQDLLLTGLFGQTGKEQSADAWACDQNEEYAGIKIQFQNAQGQIGEVVRTRRPTGLSFKVDGTDQSSGLTGREKLGGTQALVTQFTGYDLRMFTNAVYIDQERAHKFLIGTPKEKSELLYKFQGLERFEAARTLVAADLKTAKETHIRADRKWAVASAHVTAAETALSGARTALDGLKDDVATAEAACELAMSRVRELAPAYKKGVDGIEHDRNERNRVNNDYLSDYNDVAMYKGKIFVLKEAVRDAELGRDTLQQRIVETAAAIAHRADAMAELKAERFELEGWITDKQSDINMLIEAKSGAAGKVDLLSAERISLGSGACASCGRPFDNEKAIAKRKAALTAEIAAQQKVVNDATADITAGRSYIAQRQTRIDEIDRQLDSHSTLESKLETAKEQRASAPTGEKQSIEIRDLESKIRTMELRMPVMQACVAELDAAIEAFTSIETDYTLNYQMYETEKRNVAGSQARLTAARTAVARAEAAVNEANAAQYGAQQEHEAATRQMSLCTRAVECLDRNGIPAYLCGMLCPALTKAADEYAELFSDDAFKVVFEFVNGEFDCKVINSQGASSIDALSTGERATAALITAFALRSAAPKTNVLVLDEPGRGLDELGQKKFAEALSSLKQDFETILITTHEKAMEAALPADLVLTVVKENRISRVEGL